MRGDLSETPAADACRQLAGGGATGVLSISGPRGPGTVTLVAGDIVGASSPAPRARLGDRLVGAGFLEQRALTDALASQEVTPTWDRLGALLVEQMLVPPDAVRLFVQEQTLDALFDVLRWRYGAFSFTPEPVVGIPGIRVAIPVEDALAEVARRHAQWAELTTVIPDLDAVPASRGDPANAIAALEPDEFAVLASIDGDRSIRALATALGYGEYELARIVYGLVLLGVVDIELPQGQPGAALEDAGTVGEDDLPESTFADVLRELRGLDEEMGRRRAGSTAPSASSAPPSPGPAADPDPPADAAVQRNAEADPPKDGRARPPARTDDDGDVAEFLRELSRLALDDASDGPERTHPRASPTPPPARSHHRTDAPKPRRRGLFGRG